MSAYREIEINRTYLIDQGPGLRGITVAEKNLGVELEVQWSITTAPFQCGTLYKTKRFPKSIATP